MFGDYDEKGVWKSARRLTNGVLVVCKAVRNERLYRGTGEDQFSVKLQLSDRTIPIKRPHKAEPSLQCIVKQPTLHDFRLTSTNCGKQEVCYAHCVYVQLNLLFCVCRFISPTGNNPSKTQAEISCSWKFVLAQVVRRWTPPPRQWVLQMKVCTCRGRIFKATSETLRVSYGWKYVHVEAVYLKPPLRHYKFLTGESMYM